MVYNIKSWWVASCTVFWYGLLGITLCIVVGLPARALAEHVIVVVQPFQSPLFDNTVARFQEELGRDIKLQILSQKNIKAGELAAKLSAVRPLLALVFGSSALAATDQWLDISVPIFYAFVLHPGQVMDSNKGRQTFGVSMMADLTTQVSSLNDIYPTCQRVGVIYDPKKSNRWLDALGTALNQHGREIVSTAVHTMAEALAAIPNLAPRVECWWLLPDTTVISQIFFDTLMGIAFRRKQAVVGFSKKYVKQGALFSVYADLDYIAVQLADLVGQQLRLGAAAKIPAISFVKKTRVAINSYTQHSLGIVIKDSVLQSADELFQHGRVRTREGTK